MTTDRYPRTCRNGHTVAGPDDEYVLGSRRGRWCRRCRAAAQARYEQRKRATDPVWVARERERSRSSPAAVAGYERRTASGRNAESCARGRRRREAKRDAEQLARITRSGGETKTKFGDT